MLKSILTLPATVWLLGLISLMNDSASELLYPIVPLYLASVLMAGPKALGIIEGIAEATSSLLKLFAGVLAFISIINHYAGNGRIMWLRLPPPHAC